MTAPDTDIAWLAGLVDGEGSVGVSSNKPGHGHKTSIQLCMTHKPTIDRAMEVIAALGCRGQTYTYTEKDPTKHRDAHLLTVRRAWDIRLLAQQMVRFSVTKRLHWALMLEFVESRLEGVTLDGEGRVVRGGPNVRGPNGHVCGRSGESRRWWKPYSERDHEIAELLKKENRRGGSNAGSLAQPSVEGHLGAD